MPARENYLALPYGWRDILIGSEEALRWLGRSTLLELSDELDICIASSRAVQKMYESMSKRYTKDEYYRRKLEHYNGLPEAYEYTKALVLNRWLRRAKSPSWQIIVRTITLLVRGSCMSGSIKVRSRR